MAYKVLMKDDPYDKLEDVPISVNDGTLRYFLSLSDSSDNEQSIESLSKIPKVKPSQNDNFQIIEDGEYKNMPLGIVENLLGTNQISADEKEQAQVLKFIKKQSSFTGEHFKNKYPGFPERFYDILEEEAVSRVESDNRKSEVGLTLHLQAWNLDDRIMKDKEHT